MLFCYIPLQLRKKLLHGFTLQRNILVLYGDTKLRANRSLGTTVLTYVYSLSASVSASTCFRHKTGCSYKSKDTTSDTKRQALPS